MAVHCCDTWPRRSPLRANQLHACADARVATERDHRVLRRAGLSKLSDLQPSLSRRSGFADRSHVVVDRHHADRAVLVHEGVARPQPTRPSFRIRRSVPAPRLQRSRCMNPVEFHQRAPLQLPLESVHSSSMERCMQHPTRLLPQYAARDAAAPLFLRMPMVVRMTGLGRSTIYRLIAEKKFPGPVRLGDRAVAWRQSDIDRWSEERRPPPH